MRTARSRLSCEPDRNGPEIAAGPRALGGEGKGALSATPTPTWSCAGGGATERSTREARLFPFASTCVEVAHVADAVTMIVA